MVFGFIQYPLLLHVKTINMFNIVGIEMNQALLFILRVCVWLGILCVEYYKIFMLIGIAICNTEKKFSVYISWAVSLCGQCIK